MGTGAPDYFKRILLYGLYEGVATPLACDEQGRLILVAEPVSSFHKAGTILLKEVFDDGLVHCWTYTKGTGATVAMENSEAINGGYSAKLMGGSDSDRYALASFYFFPSHFNKLGVEFAVRFGPNLESLTLKIMVNSLTTKYFAELRYKWSAKEWQIYDYDSAAWATILSGESYLSAEYQFQRFKLILDIENERYHMFVSPDEEIDLVAYNLDQGTRLAYRYCYAGFYAYSNAGYNGYVLLDDIIITQDES